MIIEDAYGDAPPPPTLLGRFWQEKAFKNWVLILDLDFKLIPKKTWMSACKLDFRNHDLEPKLESIVALPGSTKMGSFDPRWTPKWSHLDPRWAQDRVMLGQDGLKVGLVLAFGSDLEVHLFKRHLQTIFGSNFGLHLGSCWDQKRIIISIFRGPRACPWQDRFWSCFSIHLGTISKGSVKAKLKFSYGRVAFFWFSSVSR